MILPVVFTERARAVSRSLKAVGADQIDEVDVTQIPGYVAPPEGYVPATI